MKKAIAIIPARMGSSRFPGKPLMPILGIPMIGHCYLRTKMSKSIIDTYVATCDEEIYEYIMSLGGKVIMTSSEHDRASDRTAEALVQAERELGYKVDLVVMVQGDEPMITPDMIEESILAFEDDEVRVVNLMAPIKNKEEFNDPNEVKVVVDSKSDAIYFSREPIPSGKKTSSSFSMFKQVCIIPFTREALSDFNQMLETDLERIESIDMLRLLETGKKVRMVKTNNITFSVDTPEDLRKVESYMKDDNLISKYNLSDT